ncbi:hypothetical protein [Micromonospora sp. NPDC049801]|uniref:hypothetical protein n=1 Tax=unclassified Micromonospora TaxID=2617518 RepID=UPI0033E5E294
MDDDSIGTVANKRRKELAKFGRDVLVNVLGGIIAAPAIYLAGAAVGLFRRTPAALTLSASILAAVLTATSFVAMFFASRTSGFARKVPRVFFAAGMSALAPGILFLTLGLDRIHRTPVGATIFIIPGVSFVVIAAGLLHSGLRNRQNPVE